MRAPLRTRDVDFSLRVSIRIESSLARRNHLKTLKPVVEAMQIFAEHSNDLQANVVVTPQKLH